MKLKFVKDGEQIETKILEGETESIFDYIQFVDKIFNGESFEGFEYLGEVSEEIKEKLQSMTNTIIETVSKKNEEQEQEERI